MDRKLFTLFEIGALGVLILAVMYFGGVLEGRPDPTRATAAATRPATLASTKASVITLPALHPASTPGTLPAAPPLTRPSGLIAFESTRDGNHEVYVVNVEEALQGAGGRFGTNLTRNPADDYLLSWSPDGRRIAFFSTRTQWLELYLMDAEGSNVVQLTDTRASNTAYGWPISWSQDGQFILAARSTPWATGDSNRPVTLDLIRTDGFGTITVYESLQGELWYAILAPDGEYLAAMMEGVEGFGAYLGRVQESPLTLNLASRSCNTFVWGPGPGRLTCYGQGALFTMNPDGTDKAGLLADFRTWPDSMAWSPDESFLLIAAMDYVAPASPSGQALILISASGTLQWTFLDYTDVIPGSTFLSWAPDSQWVAYTARHGGVRDFYIINIYDPKNILQLTAGDGDHFSPQWQP